MVEEWLPTIRRFLFVHLGNDLQACEEVQQEVLLDLLRNEGKFKGESEFSTYLYRITRNKAVDHIRKESRRRRFISPVDVHGDEGTDFQPLFGRSPGDPLDDLIKKDTADQLWALIHLLPPGDRDLLFLREIEEVSEKECAKILGIPVGTVKSRVFRIKKALFERMMREGRKS